MMRLSKTALRWVLLYAVGVCVVFAAAGPSYTTKVPSSIMDQFRAQRANWTAGVWLYANSLFGLLDIIEFAWSAAVMLLEKSDLQSWTSALVRKMMWLGAFYALRLYGGSARVASDRIRSAIKHAEQFSTPADQMREASLQLLEALERLEYLDRRFQVRSRIKASLRWPNRPNQDGVNGQGRRPTREPPNEG
jgi:type IV secretory pathway TrbL component